MPILTSERLTREILEAAESFGPGPEGLVQYARLWPKSEAATRIFALPQKAAAEAYYLSVARKLIASVVILPSNNGPLHPRVFLEVEGENPHDPRYVHRSTVEGNRAIMLRIVRQAVQRHHTAMCNIACEGIAEVDEYLSTVAEMLDWLMIETGEKAPAPPVRRAKAR